MVGEYSLEQRSPNKSHNTFDNDRRLAQELSQGNYEAEPIEGHMVSFEHALEQDN